MNFNSNSSGFDLDINTSLEYLFNTHITKIGHLNSNKLLIWEKSMESDHVLRSIRHTDKFTLKTTPGLISQLAPAVYIRNSYDIFKNRFSSYISSYPSREIEEEKRYKYGLFHNYDDIPTHEKSPNLKRLYIAEARFQYERLKSIDNIIDFVICWHDDHRNYWHWHYEILPRFLLFIEYMKTKEGNISTVRFSVVGNILSKWQYSTLTLIAGTHLDIHYTPYGFMSENSIHVNAPYPATFHPGLLKKLSEVLSLFRLNEKICLYVPRGDAKNGRLIKNEEKIFKYMQKNKIKIFLSGESSYISQQKIFASAKTIIMPHGGAFGNILYCQEGTRILDIHPYDYIHPEPLIACTHLGLDYEYIIGSGISNLDAKSSYSVNLDEIIRHMVQD